MVEDFEKCFEGNGGILFTSPTCAAAYHCAAIATASLFKESFSTTNCCWFLSSNIIHNYEYRLHFQRTASGFYCPLLTERNFKLILCLLLRLFITYTFASFESFVLSIALNCRIYSILTLSRQSRRM